MNDFDILEHLAEGSFSTIYRVRRLVDNRIYVMKQVHLSALSVRDQRNAVNEVRILASIRSPHVLAYKQVRVVESNVLCIIMEYVPSGDLSSASAAFTEVDIWDALLHLTIALRTLHYLGVLHRDVKIANVFRDESGNFKLGDMNVSKLSLHSRT
jgi:NIMA (never in mitosis gene a)-related kinase